MIEYFILDKTLPIYIYIYIYIGGVHKSIQVGFVPNPNLTRPLQVGKIRTCCQLWRKSNWTNRASSSSRQSRVCGRGSCVRLNLINHFVGFIPYQFACNSAFRNHVFRWESCKGSVWEGVKKSSKVCNLAGPCGWQVVKAGTRVKHVGELKSHASYCTTGQIF